MNVSDDQSPIIWLVWAGTLLKWRATAPPALRQWLDTCLLGMVRWWRSIIAVICLKKLLTREWVMCCWRHLVGSRLQIGWKFLGMAVDMGDVAHDCHNQVSKGSHSVAVDCCITAASFTGGIRSLMSEGPMQHSSVPACPLLPTCVGRGPQAGVPGGGHQSSPGKPLCIGWSSLCKEPPRLSVPYKVFNILKWYLVSSESF
jgi:hypothetical protein